MKRFAMIYCLMLATPVWAAEVEGVKLADQVTVAGQSLQLNGAGVRTKFFFDIYVGALYLPVAAHSSEQALAAPLPKRVTMDILYSEVGREKLVDGWTEGFKKNQSSKAFAVLAGRLNSFNALFHDAHEGDRMIFDFLSDGSTVLTLQGQEAGRIAGSDFQQALLAVWLGNKPADRDLKKAMLSAGH